MAAEPAVFESVTLHGANVAADATGVAAVAGAEEFLRAAGLAGPLRVTQLRGGKNNRAFRVEAGSKRFFLKLYFVHPGDLRNRLQAEFAFSAFAWQVGVRRLPRPVAQDPERHLGLYEFVEGRRLEAGEVSTEHVNQALTFWSELNQHKHDSQAALLETGSEACFSLAEHAGCLTRRLARLRDVGTRLDANASAVDREAAALITDELAPRAAEVCAELIHRADAYGIVPEVQLPRAEWCLSPSDFGFHNALLIPSGELRFVDFEYAGWDDPAKLVCDFFCQVEVPVDHPYLDHFAVRVAGMTPDPERHLHRMRLLLPVYQLKWCCIVLNDFLPVAALRRRFAACASERRQQELENAKAQQLARARKLLSQVSEVGST